MIDFSTEVIPHFLGKIAVWSNEGVHIDIGTLENLKKAQEIKVKPGKSKLGASNVT